MKNCDSMARSIATQAKNNVFFAGRGPPVSYSQREGDRLLEKTKRRTGPFWLGDPGMAPLENYAPALQTAKEESRQIPNK